MKQLFTSRSIPAAILAVPFLLGGCLNLVDPLPGPPSFVATVMETSTGVYDQQGNLYVTDIEVDGEPIACGSIYCPQRAWVEVRDTTAIYVRTTDGIREGSRDDIQVGDRIEVWATGEARSDPPVYSVEQIIVVQE